MIQPTSSFHGYDRLAGLNHSGSKPVTSSSAGQKPAVTDGEQLSSSSSQALRTALQNTPEVRADVVARGKALASDPSYPPLHIIEKLAELMVSERESSAE